MESRIEAPDLKGHLKYKMHGIGKHINQAGSDNDADKFVMMGQFPQDQVCNLT